MSINEEVDKKETAQESETGRVQIHLPVQTHSDSSDKKEEDASSSIIPPQQLKYSFRERKQKVSYTKFRGDYVVNEDDMDQECNDSRKGKRRKKHRYGSEDEDDSDFG